MNIKINKAAFIIALILLLFLYACGGAGGNEQKTSPGIVVADKTDGSEQQEPPATAAADNSNVNNPDVGDDDADEDNSAVSTEDNLEVSPEDSPEVSTEIETPAPSEEPVEEPPVTAGNDTEMTTADKIVALAQSLIGAPYEYGATGPDTFDNSGFVYYCFKENGISLPRKTSEMFAAGTAVAQEDLLPGDLVFFTYNEDRSPSYVGIYIGDGQFIAENKEDRPVSIHDMTLDYYQKIFVGARRY
jgi:cell wall-associated NlpC family hydrolase